MAKKSKTESTIPSVLAFEKKLVPSDAQMFATNWDKRDSVAGLPLTVQSKSVRGTISNRLSTALQDDPAKLDAEVEKPNLQTVDHCALPSDRDTLTVRFTLKVLSGVQTPSACNLESFAASYRTAAETYIDQTGFSLLGQRYATNLANGRFLWRNRVGAESIEIQVRHIDGAEVTSWTYDAKKIGLSDFETGEIQLLSSVIADALAGKREFALLEIVAHSRLGHGQEVYPSEELVTEKGTKGRILYSTDGVAGMHSQKIGNAIRTIDTWYADQPSRPIAIEVYGAVTNLGTAYRKPKVNDFYTLFDKFGQGGSISAEQRHYVMAMLVRGGVFGLSSK